MPISINQDNFDEAVMSATGLVVLDIYATWCGPCKQMEPIINELETEFAGKCHFAKLNVEESRDIAVSLNVTSVPTFIFVRDGNIVEKMVGYIGKEQMKHKIESYL